MRIDVKNGVWLTTEKQEGLKKPFAVLLYEVVINLRQQRNISELIYNMRHEN